MTEPSKEKTPELNNELDDLGKKLFGRSRTGSIKTDTCISCGEPAKEFKNLISAKEYTISGLCQKCQDGMFGTD